KNPHRFLELANRPEEQRAIDLKYLDTLWYLDLRHVAALELFILLKRVCDRIHPRLGRHFLQEQKCGEQDAYLNSNRKFDNDGEEEGYKKNGDIAPRAFQEMLEFTPLAHVVRHYDESCRKRCHRDHRGRLSDQKQHKEKKGGVYHCRDRGLAAAFDIRRGPGDRSCCRDPAKDRGSDIARPLRNQFHVG